MGQINDEQHESVHDLSRAPAFTNSAGEVVSASSNQFLDNIAFVDHFGQAVVGELNTNISLNFAYGIVDEIYDVKPPLIVGDGIITADDGYIQASSVTGSAAVESRDNLRYSNGRGFYSSFTASFESIGEGDGVGYAGATDAINPHDGFPLKYDSATDTLTFGYYKEGTLIGEIVIDHVALDIDLTKLNIWIVIGGFLGVANPTLLLRKDVWQLAGVIKTEGRLDGTHLRLPSFPSSIRTEGNMTVKSGSWHAGTVGDAGVSQDRGFTYPHQIFSGITGGDNPGDVPRGRLNLGITPGEVHTVFNIHVKDLYNSLPNKIRADLVNISIMVVPTDTGSGTVQAQMIGNVTNYSVEPVYTDISDSSIIEVDDNPDDQATGRYGSGGFIVGEPLNIPYAGGQGSNTSATGQSENLVQELQLDGIANDNMSLLLRDLGGNSVDVYWFFTWVEKQI